MCSAVTIKPSSERPMGVQPWMSMALFMIRCGLFGLVELRELEPLSPCLQSSAKISITV